MSDTLKVLQQYRHKQSGTHRVTDAQLRAQAHRSDEIVAKFVHSRSVLLGDPVGTGKTPVALTAARTMRQAGTIENVLIVAPSRRVAKQWRDRAEDVGLEARLHTPKQRWRHLELKVATPSTLPGGAGPDRATLLVIIDEAHRGLQDEDGKRFRALQPWCRGARVLLVTATPMQLSPRGFETMVGIASSDNGAGPPMSSLGAYARSLRSLIDAVAPLKPKERTDAVSTLKSQERTNAAIERARSLRQPAEAEMAPHLLSAFDPRALKVPPLPRLKDTTVPFDRNWAIAFHTARLIPDLVGARGHAMFARMLVSSSEAFWDSEAGRRLGQLADRSGDHGDLWAFTNLLRARLGQGTDHPKIRHTVEWVTQQYQRGRHVLVFAFFVATQQALGDALKAQLGAANVATPTAVPTEKEWRRFRDEEALPLVLVGRDNLSESIDLDGAKPCVVMHDLVWNPIRLQQRFGRICRISSGFQTIAPEDVFTPVLDCASDRRMFDTVTRRGDYSQLLLPGADESFWALPEDVILKLTGMT